MMKFNKNPEEMTLKDLWKLANRAVCNKKGCRFQLGIYYGWLYVNDLTITIENTTTGERWEKIYMEQPEEMEAVQFLAQILLYW